MCQTKYAVDRIYQCRAHKPPVSTRLQQCESEQLEEGLLGKDHLHFIFTARVFMSRKNIQILWNLCAYNVCALEALQ